MRRASSLSLSLSLSLVASAPCCSSPRRPLLSTLSRAGILEVAGANRGQQRFDIDDVREAIIKQSDAGATMGWVLGIPAAIAFVILFVYISTAD